MRAGSLLPVSGACVFIHGQTESRRRAWLSIGPGALLFSLANKKCFRRPGPMCPLSAAPVPAARLGSRLALHPNGAFVVLFPSCFSLFSPPLAVFRPVSVLGVPPL